MPPSLFDTVYTIYTVGYDLRVLRKMGLHTQQESEHPGSLLSRDGWHVNEYLENIRMEVVRASSSRKSCKVEVHRHDWSTRHMMARASMLAGTDFAFLDEAPISPSIKPTTHHIDNNGRNTRPQRRLSSALRILV
jgi:hypothetical protein